MKRDNKREYMQYICLCAYTKMDLCIYIDPHQVKLAAHAHAATPGKKKRGGGIVYTYIY